MEPTPAQAIILTSRPVRRSFPHYSGPSVELTFFSGLLFCIIEVGHEGQNERGKGEFV